jgi:hypothetical protein
MKDSEHAVSRREALKDLIVLPALAAFIFSATSPAQAKGSKAQFKYQTHPQGNQKCSGCKFFTKGKSATANGTCTIVDGAISPNGWCDAFAKS